MDNIVDTNDIDIDTIDINSGININDTNNIDIYEIDQCIKLSKKYFFKFR